MAESKVTFTQTVKAEQTEGDELFGVFNREMSSNSFPAAASKKEEEEQPEIYPQAMLKQPVIKLHRIGECMFFNVRGG